MWAGWQPAADCQIGLLMVYENYYRPIFNRRQDTILPHN
jgi:hypothetical protein